ncbi:MAG: hypothetical protein IKX63_00860 [Muribaculaceae bacterium]|nr:hypothetical protein [Muribaculaceae bacterium]
MKNVPKTAFDNEIMTAQEKKKTWILVGAAVAVLVLLYIFCPPVHKFGNKLLGRSEKEYPKPDTLKVDEFEYGKPVEDLKGEIIDVPRDTLLDSLLLGDSTLMGMVRPVDGPPPTPVPGFGDGPLPPMPSEDDLPIVTSEKTVPAVKPAVIDEIEQHTSPNANINSRIASCRSNYNKLLDLYNEYVKKPSSEMQEIGNKRKEEMLKELSQLMKAAQSANDDGGMEEAADLRRQVNKMKF